MTAQRFKIVLVTVPDLKTARKLARLALQARLVACASLIPKIESHFWWQGKLERSAELLIVFKTTRRCLQDLETLILTRHPYHTPEFVVVPIAKGSRRYLEWLDATCSGKPTQG